MSLPDARFWKDKQVLVTGHTGFKGSWLCLWLSRLGAQMHGLSVGIPTEPGLYTEAHVREVMSSETTADVRNAAAVCEAIQRIKPQIVFHLAAQSLVRRSYRQPLETFATNMMGTANVLEAVRQADSVRVCQVITTDKCYENDGRSAGFRESDPLGGHDPYSSSKAGAEIVAQSYRRSFFSAPGALSLATARAGNVIGGGDWAEDRIIPDCIRALLRGEPITVRNPAAIRPFQHVLEPLCGYLMLAEAQWQRPAEVSRAFNFGPNAESHATVQRLVETLIECWGEGSWRKPDLHDAPHEASYLHLDISLARQLLGWQPRWTLRRNIEATAAWYRGWSQKMPARELCLDQIGQYAEGA